jgi:hypothetical protein
MHFCTALALGYMVRVIRLHTFFSSYQCISFVSSKPQSGANQQYCGAGSFRWSRSLNVMSSSSDPIYCTIQHRYELKNYIYTNHIFKNLC